MKKVNILFLLALTGLFVACTTTKDRDPASGDKGTQKTQQRHFNWHERFMPGDR